jgi:acyl-CoA reductase-like NAD-dependent aldehyde dehydrogenase
LFGPVFLFFKVVNESEVIALAHHTPLGLAGTIFRALMGARHGFLIKLAPA